MVLTNYSEYQQLTASEKIGLITLEASKRLNLFTLDSGFIYKTDDFDHSIVLNVQAFDDSLIEVLSLGSMIQGSFFNDRTNKELYVWLSDDSNPNDSFIFATFKNFFSNVSVHAPYDLSAGEDVIWLPYLLQTSDFGVQLDNSGTNVGGKAIEGNGEVTFLNFQNYWSPIFDKWVFENHEVKVYSWNRNLPITEAKIIYRGTIERKSWNEKQVRFGLKDFLKELDNELNLGYLEDVPNIKVPDEWLRYRQRRLYGYNFGIRPQNIDHILEDTGYQLNGTISLVNLSDSVVGVGTSFLNDFNPGDSIFVSDLPDEQITIKSITDDTNLVLESSFEFDSLSNVSYSILPADGTGKRYANRIYKIAGHPLREVNVTVTDGISLSSFEVTDASDILPGDDILIDGTIRAVVDSITNNIITITSTLVSIPAISTTVKRPSLTNVRINDRLLVELRDYTYNPTTAVLTLDQEAEKNVANIISITGTSVTFTSGLRTVSGINTLFKTDLKSGDWISMNLHTTEFFEILEVIDDTNLLLKTSSTFTDTQLPKAKRPIVYIEGESVITCDALGKTNDNTINGSLIKTHANIVKDLIDNDADLASFLNNDSIDESNIQAPQLCGLVHPLNYDDNRVSTIRNIIDDINKSVLGVFIQNPDFELEFNILRPEKPSDMIKIREHDIFKMSVETDSRNIFAETQIKYARKEYDYVGKDESFQVSVASSLDAIYLSRSDKINEVITLFKDQDDALLIAKRLALFFSRAITKLNIDSTIKLSRLKITDKVDVSHEKLFERFGSIARRKIATINLLNKSITDTNMELQDLNGALTRIATFTENDSVEYVDAEEDERVINGYWVDSDCIVPSFKDTFGLNLFW